MDHMYAGPGPGGPPLQNPPPQIFGTGAAPAPMNVSYADAFMPDDFGAYGFDGYDGQGDNDGGDPKRRRIARACDMCRKKKIKCDGKMPKCSHCENYKTECIFTQVEKKRNPPKGAKYIEGLENRLGRMESLLRMSGLLAEDDGGRTDLGTLEKKLAEQARGHSMTSGSASPPRREKSTSLHGTPRMNHVSSPHSVDTSSPKSSSTKRPEEKKEVEALADQMCSLVTNNVGETRYIGSSSGFSIFSPKGIEWVREKTGDDSFQEMIQNAAANDQQWYQWKPEVFGDIFGRRTFQPLPPKQVAVSLLKDFFENFNCMFPLFHEPTFMHLVHKHYSLEPYEGSGWWACLNVALAVAHRMRVMSNVSGSEEDQLAWMYLKNALAVQSELTMRNNDLLSVQALLGIALFMQGTPNPQPSFFFVAAAIRLSHSIGLHKRGSDFKLNEVENEQRKRVFWIAYMLDKDMALRSGRPPTQDDDDMNVELPSEDPPDNIGNVPSSNPSGKFNLFRLMAEFAMIQSRVYKQLYSVKASKQTDGELLNTIGELDNELEAWKDSIPPEYRPDNEIKAQHAPLVLHIVCIHFAYYNCLTTIHRMAVHHGYWTSRLSDFAIAGLNARPLNPRVFMSAALCVNAARTSISLIKYVPQGDHACVWLVLYYPISALVTLFANVLQNPQDVRARSDVRLMSSVVEFLTMLAAEESHGHVRRMLSICVEFERISRMALEKAEREIRGRNKRGHKEDMETPQKTIIEQQIEAQASYRKPVSTPSLRAASISGGAMAAAMNHASPGSDPGRPSVQAQQAARAMSQPQADPNHLTAPTPGFSTTSSPLSPGPWINEQVSSNGFYPHSADFVQTMPTSQPAAVGIPQFSDADISAMTNGNTFQQPFVPQDLWQMPMTLEWDWSDAGMMGPNMNVGMGSGTIYDFQGNGMGGMNGMPQ
ncbi:fungal-specific transcription factor domain-containing protein [Elsinoe ampelina]|uniref:Fungal-specific transcription factor domain-containing protein n=1 Tax=Elsinoe ampelina TaxID=302913 RepID=A0A6A6GAX6_9PEZI|nr:fungal-specific transcription factor domain-containing protein [Elsinoe ampelina]